MGGCLETASVPVLRTRLHPSVTLSCLSTWLKAETTLLAVKTQAFRHWSGLLSSSNRRRRVAAKKVAFALGKAVAQTGFKRLKKLLLSGEYREKVHLVLSKAAFRALKGRFHVWRAQSYRRNQALSRLHRRTYPVLQHLARGPKVALRSAISLWRQQALKAVSVPAQSRKLALIRLKLGIKAPVWRLIKRKMRKKSAYTDYFTAIVRIGRGLAGLKLRQSLRLWVREAEIRGNQRVSGRTKALVVLEELGRLLGKRRKQLGVERWQRWKEWRGKRNAAGILTGKSYSQACVLRNPENAKICTVKQWEISGKPVISPCFLVKIRPIRKDLKAISNISLVQKAQRVFVQAEKGFKGLVAGSWITWKEACVAAGTRKTRANRGRTKLRLALMGANRRNQAFSWAVIRKQGSYYWPIAHAVRLLERIRLKTAGKAMSRWVYWAAGRADVTAMRAKALQRALYSIIRPKTPFLFLKHLLNKGKSLRRVAYIHAKKTNEWLNRWKRLQSAVIIHNILHKSRKSRLEGLIRTRIRLNSRFYFRFFVKKLTFPDYIRNFLPKVANRKEKQLVKQAISLYSKQIRREKWLPAALPGLLRDQLERLPREVMAKWRDWAAEEGARRQGRRSYIATAVGTIGSSLGLGRLRSFFRRS